MKVGLIGLGAISSYFIEAITADSRCALAAVCDLDADKLAAFVGSGTLTFSSYEELLASGTVEAVVITLPNDLHLPVTLAALAAGVHVCCEKPLAISIDDATRLVEAARTNGRVLFTAFHRRYNHNVETLKEKVQAARSAIVAVRCRYEENIFEHTGGDRWYLDLDRCGGGCVIDNGPNALDVVRHVVGPIRLEDATIGDVRSGVEFCAELRLRTLDGAPVTVVLDWALETGERKDITVELADGTSLEANMLAGFPGFKSSLSHEYAGIISNFHEAVESSGIRSDSAGAEIVTLVQQAYDVARRKEYRSRMVSKEALSSQLVKLFFHERNERGMVLAPWGSRCVRAGDVHEIVTTTDDTRRAGNHVDHVGFVGFVKFNEAGLVEVGDEVLLDDRHIGTVAGFDECHSPNHINILVSTRRQLTAAHLDASLGQALRFREAPQ